MRRVLALLTVALLLLAPGAAPAAAQSSLLGGDASSGGAGWLRSSGWLSGLGGGGLLGGGLFGGLGGVGTDGPTPPPSGTPASDPIVFVHGYGMTGSTAWGPMLAMFAADGRRDGLYNMTYSTAQDLTSTAREVGRRVDQALRETGAQHVDIVCHSMGCLASRHYLKDMGGTAKVDQWVSLGGANEGTAMATTCVIISAGCRDMVPGSTFERRLNRGDGVPGPTTYYTLWSRGDGVIIPATNTPIEGATNIELPGTINHVGMLSDRRVYEQVREILG